jgi:quinolinate synthetase A subunit
MNVEKGYVDEPIQDGIDLREEILRLKRERNAVIMAHYYQREEIQQLADHIGDSLALAQLAAKTDAPVIVLCGVHFMGETAKILCPDKTVIVPDLSAGCSLADSCPADEFERFVNVHPGHTVISYVNTSAAVKAVTDVVVTSSNAKEIVGSLPEDEKIIFGPDRNLGNYINSITGRDMILWDGACHVHEKFSVQKLVDLKRQYPDAKEEYLATKESIKALGVTPQTTYLYIQGHHLFDTVVSPILSKVCNLLRQARQTEINRARAHQTQKQNEMTCYENSLQDIKVMLKKNSGYMASEQFRRVQEDIRYYLEGAKFSP